MLTLLCVQPPAETIKNFESRVKFWASETNTRTINWEKGFEVY